MFKIVSSVGEWHTLFVSPTASAALRRFLPEQVAYEEGAIDVDDSEKFTIERLLMSDDKIRPKVVLLICEPSVALSVSTRIRSELMEILRRILSYDSLTESVQERRELDEYCTQLSKAVEKEAVERRSWLTDIFKTTSLARNLAIGALLCAILFPALMNWFGNKGQTTVFDPDLEKRVESLEGEMATANSKISSQEAEISDMQKEIEKIKKKLPTNAGLSSTSRYLTLKSDGRNGVVSWKTRSVKLEDEFGELVLFSRIEIVEPNELSQFSELKSRVVDKNQIIVDFRSVGEIQDDVVIRVHVIYRE